MVSSEKTATINVSNGMLSYWPPLDEASLATDDLSAEEHQFLAGFTIDPTTGHATQSFDPIDTNIGGSQAELTAEQNARYWANKLAWLLRQVFGIVPDCKTNQTAERYNGGVSEDDLACRHRCNDYSTQNGSMYICANCGDTRHIFPNIDYTNITIVPEALIR